MKQITNAGLEPGCALNEPRKRAVVAYFLKTKRLVAAVRKAGVPYEQHKEWLRTDQNYRMAIEGVKEQIPQMLRDAAISWALDGIETPIISNGEIAGYYKKKDWRMLLGVIDRFGDKQDRLQPTQITINNMTILDQLLEERQRRMQASTEVPGVVIDQVTVCQESQESNGHALVPRKPQER